MNTICYHCLAWSLSGSLKDNAEQLKYWNTEEFPEYLKISEGWGAATRYRHLLCDEQGMYALSLTAWGYNAP